MRVGENLEKLFAVRSHPIWPNTQSRSRSSTAFQLASIGCSGTSSRCASKWRRGRSSNSRIPLGSAFWVVLTGIAFVMAGLAIISGVLDVLAARLLGLMLLVFSALALAPLVSAFPRKHWTWGANACNLTAVGAAWIFAEWLAYRRQSVQHAESATPAKPFLA